MTDRQIIRTLARRAFCYLKKGNIEKAIEDVTCTINGGKERLDLSDYYDRELLAELLTIRGNLLSGLDTPKQQAMRALQALGGI